MDTKSIEIIVDSKNNQTRIKGSDDAWYDLAIILEGLSVMIIKNAYIQKKAPDEIKKYCLEYLENALRDYKLL